MNSPLIIFQKYLPQELIDKIHQYLQMNDFTCNKENISPFT